MNNFDKIIGYTSEKEEMIRLCDVFKNSEKYLRLGVKIPKAILLYGKPGLGKTLMAKAFIAETERNIYHCKKNKSNGEFVNEIKETFENAIKNVPSIIFFDDMDKFAEDNLQRNCNKEEFVAIQTGLEDIADKDVFVIATANDVDYLPDSLMREGRFGKQIEFTTPSFSDSVKIIEHFLSGKRLSAEVKAESLAHILAGNSCAMLESVINEAGIYAAYENRLEMNQADVKRAVAKVVLKQRKLNNIDDKTKLQIVYHEAGHAVLNIVSGKSVGCIAVGKCGQDGTTGVCCVSGIPSLFSSQDYENYVMALLAGRASVEIQFGKVDMGAVKDLESAMNEIDAKVTMLAVSGFEFLYTEDSYSNRQSFRQLDRIYEKKICLLEALYKRTKFLLLENKFFLNELAQELYKKEVLLYDEIHTISAKYGY